MCLLIFIIYLLLLKKIYIFQVTFVIGSTIINAKETYSLLFPNEFYEGLEASIKKCKTLLLHQLFSPEISARISEPANKIHVLVEASRDCSVCKENLLPKPNFKIPSKGFHFTWKFVSSLNPSNANLSCVSETGDFDISGIEPFDRSQCDFTSMSTKNGCFRSASNVDESIVCKKTDNDQVTTRIRKSSHTQVCTDELMWFQIPVLLK